MSQQSRLTPFARIVSADPMRLPMAANDAPLGPPVVTPSKEALRKFHASSTFWCMSEARVLYTGHIPAERVAPTVS
jgi:hypothetical protein